MRNVSLSSITDAYYIFSNGEDVLVAGKHLWLFRADGSFVTKFAAIRLPMKAVFLPNRRVLVDGYGDKAYHYIALDSGEVLWRSNKKGRRMMESNRFAVSPDGMTIYDTCYIQNKAMQIDRICPENKSHETFMIDECLRVTEDIFCDKTGALCALQTHLIIDPDDPYSEKKTPVRQHGLLSISFENGTAVPHWTSQWQSQNGDISHGFARACDGTHILYEDLSVLDMNKQVILQLLSPEETAQFPKDGFTWTYDCERKLLTVSFVSSLYNYVIDCDKKKIVAKYGRCDSSVGYQGCLVGDEFWMGTADGIVKRPFPNIDFI